VIVSSLDEALQLLGARAASFEPVEQA
jgi:hypothetical protein